MLPTRVTSGVRFEPALVRKYDVSGPRYTSYPTAAQFTPEFAPSTYVAAAAGDADAPLSLYVHIPFCATVCYYCACNRVVTKNRAHAATYLDRLEQEIERQAQLLAAGRPVRQLYWGGGTPTFLDGAQRARLTAALTRHFHCVPGPELEYSIEIGPRACPPAACSAISTAIRPTPAAI